MEQSIKTIRKGIYENVEFKELDDGIVVTAEVGDELISIEYKTGGISTLFISYDSPTQQIKCLHDPQDGINTKISDPELEGLRDLLMSLVWFESYKME